MPGEVLIPDSVILSWPAPNRIAPQVQGPAFVIIAIIFGALAFSVVSARMWARFVILRSPSVDDYVLLAAVPPTVLVITMAGVCIGPYQWNHHVWDITVDNVISGRRAVYILQIVYVIAASLIKISVLFFYRHLATRVFSSWFKYTVYACITSVVVYLIVYLFLCIFVCKPIASFWEQFNPLYVTEHDFKCIPPQALSVASAVISLVQDFVAATLPLSMFAGLKMRKAQKVALMGVFAMGFFSCVAGTLRVYYIYKIYYLSSDGTWESYYVFLWSIIELLGAMICGSAPTLKIYFRNIRNLPTTSVLSHTHRHRLPWTRSSSSQGIQTTHIHVLPTHKPSVFSTRSNFFSSIDQRSSSNDSSAIAVVGGAPLSPTGGVVARKEAEGYECGLPVWYKEGFLDDGMDVVEFELGEGRRGERERERESFGTDEVVSPGGSAPTPSGREVDLPSESRREAIDGTRPEHAMRAEPARRGSIKEDDMV